MLGKLVQLLGVPMEDGFRVVYGLDFCMLGTADCRFVSFRLGHNPLRQDYKVIYCWGIGLPEKDDGFIEYMVNNNLLVDCKPEEKEVEERLWVIIPYSSKIETTAKRIAGRYPEESMLEMQAGDTVTVEKAGAEPETYMAVQAGNEMFLIKKNR